jgi:hypothetical protein
MSSLESTKPSSKERNSNAAAEKIEGMHTYGVILRGYKDFDYYQADAWQSENGAATLIKNGVAIAMFPFENLLGIVDLTAGTRLTGEQARDTLRSQRNMFGRTSSNDGGPDV